jgi:hypothetical protein
MRLFSASLLGPNEKFPAYEVISLGSHGVGNLFVDLHDKRPTSTGPNYGIAL